MGVKSEYTFKVTRHELIRIMSALFVAQMNANEAYLLTGSSEDKRSYDGLCQVINKICDQRDEQEI